MADAVLGRGVEFGGAGVQGRIEENRVVAEAACRRAVRRGCGRASGLRRSAARDRRRCRSTTIVQWKCAVACASGTSRSAPQQLRDVRRRVAMAPGVARRMKSGRAVECIDAESGIIAQCRQARSRARVARLDQRVLDEGARSRRHPDAELGLRDEFDTEIGEHRAFREFAAGRPLRATTRFMTAQCEASVALEHARKATDCIMRETDIPLHGLRRTTGKDGPHATGARSCSNTLRIRCASASRWLSSAEVRLNPFRDAGPEQRVELLAAKRMTFGGALQFDEAAAVVHDDIHVGIAVRILGIVEIEHRYALRQMPTETAATAPTTGLRLIACALVSQAIASHSAT